ncbi:FecR domain-containing protein [Maridesulfovibrio sp. FT414]|uniref:FecR domain-containing protein n=1 Tax=Maridesulfovibrio sp. FT414 TaxID=2979469 RepID=UPI003D809F81
MRRFLQISIIPLLLIWTVAVSAASAASLDRISGTVDLRRVGQDFFLQARIGQAVWPGDILRTGADGKAILILDDGSSLSFSGETEFMLGRELAGESRSLIGTLLRGVARAVLNKRAGSYIATPSGSVGIRGTDITISHSGETGFYFLDEGNVGIKVEGDAAPLDAGQMTASYAGRRPLPPFPFTKSAGLAEARSKLSAMTSIEIPPSLKDHAQLNEILARWIINYAHYLADAGRPEDAQTALLIAEGLTEERSVKGEILLQIGGLYFYQLSDVKGALRSYRRIIREYHRTSCYENALYGAIRCFLLLDQQTKAEEYARWYKVRFPDGKHIHVIESLIR